MTELDPKALHEAERAYYVALSDLSPLSTAITVAIRAYLAASQQQGPEIKGLKLVAWRFLERGEWDYSDGPEQPYPGNSYPVEPLFGGGKRKQQPPGVPVDARIRTALAPSVGAEEPTVDALRHECAKAGPCSDMHDGCSCSDAELLKPHKGEPTQESEMELCKPYVQRNEPGHAMDGGRVVVKFRSDAEMEAILALLGSQAPIPEGMVRAAFNSAINFALDKLSGSESADFLRAWREGDTSEWPEFAATPAPQAEPGAGE